MPDYQNIFNYQSEKYDKLISKEDYKNHIVQALQEITDFRQKRIIEFGAGTGRLSFMISPIAKSIMAMDISQAMLDTAIRKQKENGIKNITFRQMDSLSLPELDYKYDIAIQGWSFLAVVAFSQDGWTESNYKNIFQTLVHNMEKSTKREGTLIIIETLGTFEATPKVPEEFANIYTYLEEELGFTRNEIRTDYKFDSIEQAADLMSFFFGEEYRDKVLSNAMYVIPECTGIWYRKNDRKG